MRDSRDNLAPKQVKALTALLAGHSVEAAAVAAGVGVATLHRWLNDPQFRAAQQAGRRELAQMALSQLQSITRGAVGVIAELIADRAKPPSVRLRAAQIVIEASAKWLELEDFEMRLAALEARDAQKDERASG
jgi:transposase